ncbi:MAG: hypothetical protein J7513_00150, partial [Solirubrobacteraceae bacterium]|nr:hypothetical protein [Solirubrobacteraceae bacterium]
HAAQPATAAAAAVAAAPAPAPSARPSLRDFVVLPGGATQAIPGRGRRLSTSAIVLSALVAIVFTVGAIVAAQIRVTQMNEQIGSDLGRISQLQQETVAQKERISSLVTSAKIDDEAARQQLIEPDPVDVTYLSTGNRASVAERAAKALRQRPINPIGSAAAADAAEKADDAGTAQTATGTGTPGTTGTTTATTATGTTATGATGTATGATATATPQSGVTTP